MRPAISRSPTFVPASPPPISREFRVITLGIDHVALNQGLPSYELVTQRPTFLQHFVTRSVDPRQTDQIALDSLDLEITDLATNHTTYKTIPYSGTVPTTLGAPSAAQVLDTVNSINVPNIFLNTALSGGTVQIKSILKNRGYTVAQTTTTAKLAGNQPLRVLFVPIMHPGFNSNDLNAMKANVTKDIGPLTYRLMPQGLVQWFWSDRRTDELRGGHRQYAEALRVRPRHGHHPQELEQSQRLVGAGDDRVWRG